MEHAIPSYRQEDDLKNSAESYQYLREIHTAMADRLFDRHTLRVAKSTAMSSIAYVWNHDMYLCFETYFDDCGDTCHRVYHMSEAKRLFAQFVADEKSRQSDIQKRRAEIHIVRPTHNMT